MTIKQFPTLYTIDSKQKVRIWRMEVDGNKFRTVAGLEDGEKVESGWTVAEAKNVGRANATSAEQQAEAEVLAQYKKKIDRKYHEDRSKVGGSKFLAPMLADKYADEKDLVIALIQGDPLDKAALKKLRAVQAEFASGCAVYSQPKFDGMRCIASQANNLMSRGGKPIISVPHILEALQDFWAIYPDAVFDGELYNHALKADFNTIMSLCKQQKPVQEDFDRSRKMVQYHIYDIASHKGTFSERLAVLAELFAKRSNSNTRLVAALKDGNDCLQLARTDKVTSPEQLDALMAEYLEDQYEGQMVRLDLPYENKRSVSLQKRKEFDDNEYPVDAIEEGKGNWAGYAKRLICTLPDGRKFGAGIRGTQEQLEKLLNESRNGNMPVSATVRHAPLTPDGIPRFGVAVDFQGKEGRWY
jgi:DNA ligase-1